MATPSQHPRPFVLPPHGLPQLHLMWCIRMKILLLTLRFPRCKSSLAFSLSLGFLPFPSHALPALLDHWPPHPLEIPKHPPFLFPQGRQGRNVTRGSVCGRTDGVGYRASDKAGDAPVLSVKHYLTYIKLGCIAFVLGDKPEPTSEVTCTRNKTIIIPNV